MDRGQKGTVFPNWIVAEEAVDPQQRWRGMIVSSFWPNTWQQTKQKIFFFFLIHADLIFRSPLRKQSTITLQPFQSGCTNRAQKKNGLVFFFSPLFHIHIKLSFASPLRHRKSADLPPDRVGEEGDAEVVGLGSGRNSQPRQLTLKWCPLGMIKLKWKKRSARFNLLLQSSAAERGSWFTAPALWHGAA